MFSVWVLTILLIAAGCIATLASGSWRFKGLTLIVLDLGLHGSINSRVPSDVGVGLLLF